VDSLIIIGLLAMMSNKSEARISSFETNPNHQIFRTIEATPIVFGFEFEFRI
jgi:hypothetical protein